MFKAARLPGYAKPLRRRKNKSDSATLPNS
jgi:hypothetical protein